MPKRISHLACRQAGIANRESENRLIFLVGPTSAGKSEVAVSLAQKIGAEIISCDSMQVYKGMDILTSMPSMAGRRRIPHHLIRFLKPCQEYNVARYRSQALKKAQEIIKRGRIPLFVGGTGHYMSILIDGLFQYKTQNKRVRQRLYAEAQESGNQFLYNRLKKVDPRAAARIHPHDLKRVVRALEVFESSGKPISELQKQRLGLGDEYKVRIFCLNMPRERLYQKIDERVEEMFKKGLACEIKKLLKKRLSQTASYAIGIRELKGFFCGRYDLIEAKRLMQRNTRRYAKRQLTWFGKDKRIEWIQVRENETAAALAKRLYQIYRVGG